MDVKIVPYKSANTTIYALFLIVLIIPVIWLLITLSDINQKLNDPLKDSFIITSSGKSANDGTEAFINKALEDGIITNLSTYSSLNASFLKSASDSIVRFAGRTTNAGDPQLDIIMDAEINNAIGVGLKKGKKGIIVTRRLIEKLGYKNNPVFLHIHFQHHDGFDLSLPVPVRAVVNKIPGVINHKRLDFICFDNSILDLPQSVKFYKRGLTIAVTSKNNSQQEIIQSLTEVVHLLRWKARIEPLPDDTILNQPVSFVRIDFLPAQLSPVEKERRFDHIVKTLAEKGRDYMGGIWEEDMVLIYQYDVEHWNQSNPKNIISYQIPFDKKVLDWAESYENESGYVMDTSKLETFLQLQKVKWVLIVALIVNMLLVAMWLLFYFFISRTTGQRFKK